jgi:hypothetical protein
MNKTKIQTPKLGELAYSFDFFYEQWIKAGRPQKHSVLCYFGKIDRAAKRQLEEYGFSLTEVENTVKGTTYRMELV